MEQGDDAVSFCVDEPHAAPADVVSAAQDQDTQAEGEQLQGAGCGLVVLQWADQSVEEA